MSRVASYMNESKKPILTGIWMCFVGICLKIRGKWLKLPRIKWTFSTKASIILLILKAVLWVLREIRDFLVLLWVFVRWNTIIKENLSFTDYLSGIRLLYCSKLALNWKMTMTSQFFDVMPSPILLTFFLFLVKFHVNIITGSGVMTFFFTRDWPEIRKLEIHRFEFFQICGDWRELGRNTKVGTNISNKMLLKFVKCQIYNIWRFGVIVGKPTGFN